MLNKAYGAIFCFVVVTVCNGGEPLLCCNSRQESFKILLNLMSCKLNGTIGISGLDTAMIYLIRESLEQEG